MKDNPVILSVETATRLGSVCLSRRNEVLVSVAGENVGSHSNTLLKQIQEVLARAQVSLGEVDLFAAASGPGSFTGLRIGLATIKGLAATLNLPCIGVPTLQAVALSGGISASSLAILPAGRGEVFAQRFAVNSEDSIVELDEPTHLPLPELLLRYTDEPDIVWCGEAAQSHHAAIFNWANKHGMKVSESFADTPRQNPGWAFAPADALLARHVAILAGLRLQRGDTADPNSLRALYVRPSDAELNSNAHNATRN